MGTMVTDLAAIAVSGFGMLATWLGVRCQLARRLDLVGQAKLGAHR